MLLESEPLLTSPSPLSERKTGIFHFLHSYSAGVHPQVLQKSLQWENSFNRKHTRINFSLQRKGSCPLMLCLCILFSLSNKTKKPIPTLQKHLDKIFTFASYLIRFLHLTDNKVKVVMATDIFIGSFWSTLSPDKFDPLCAFHMTCLSVICKLWSSQEGLIQSSTQRKVHFGGQSTLLQKTVSSGSSSVTHVRYCTTRNITKQVTIIPPIMKYLSWKARFSISRITVLDKPNVLATSRIFFWVP